MFFQNLVVVLLLVFPSCTPFYYARGTLLPPDVWFGGCDKKTDYPNLTKYYWFRQNLRTQANFTTNCVTKIDSTVFCNKDTDHVYFSCEASYPITWTYSEFRGMEIEYSRSSIFSNNGGTPTNKAFKGTIKLSCNNASTFGIRITCAASSVDSRLSTNLYITKEDRDVQFAGKTLNISFASKFTNQTVNSIVLPCLPINEGNRVKLEKNFERKINSTTTWIFWQQPNFTATEMTYDPTIGFTINLSKIPVDSLIGLYRCSVVNGSHWIKFNVTNNVLGHSEFTSVFKVSSGASFSIKPYYVPGYPPFKEIKCCSGVKGKPPYFKVYPCATQAYCDYTKLQTLQNLSSAPIQFVADIQNSASSTDCMIAQVGRPAQVVICQGENIHVQEFYVDVFHQLSNLPLKSRVKQILEKDNLTDAENPQIPLLTRYVPESNFDKMDSQQKVLIAVLWRAQNRSEYHFDERFQLYTRFMEIFKANFTDPIQVPFAVSNDKKIYNDLREYNRNIYYEGEPMTILCLGIELFHSRGGVIRIKWENGTFTNVPMESMVERQGSQFVFFSERAFIFEGSDRERTVSVLSKVVNASKGMDSVECWMPRMGSCKWDKLTQTVEVQKAAFKENEEETVWLNQGDKMLTVNCTIAEWKPKAIVSVTWNDIPLDIEWRNGSGSLETNLTSNLDKHVRVIGTRNSSNEMISLRIVFYQTKADKLGKYICYSINGNMQVSRTIFVKSHNTLKYWLLCVGGIAVLACSILIFKIRSNNHNVTTYI